MVWAKKAFQFLPGADIAEGSDDLDTAVAFFRFLVLAGIYRDFCEVAWEEPSDIDYAEWCEPADVLDRFVVGQLLGRSQGWSEGLSADYSAALDFLVECEREIVFGALLMAFGGVSKLYAGLWNSRKFSEESDGDEDDDDEDDCFEADEVGKVKAYTWVSEGCPRVAERLSEW